MSEIESGQNDELINGQPLEECYNVVYPNALLMHNENARDESTHDESTHDENTHNENTHDESTHNESAHDESAHEEHTHHRTTRYQIDDYIYGIERSFGLGLEPHVRERMLIVSFMRYVQEHSYDVLYCGTTEATEHDYIPFAECFVQWYFTGEVDEVTLNHMISRNKYDRHKTYTICGLFLYTMALLTFMLISSLFK